MAFSEFAWLIPIFPLISFVVVGFLGNKLFKRWEGGGPIAILMAAISCVLSLLVAYEILTESIELPFVQTFTWLTVGDFQFNMGIYLDTLTAVMLIVVSFISTLVVIYSIGYMHEEGEKKRRYYAVISLFIGVMLGLVLASNFLEMFIFWELVGLCSYLLIGFWYTKPSAASAAKKAFLTTRIGDIMLMIGLFIFFVGYGGNLDFAHIFENPLGGFEGDTTLLTIGTFMIFGGAIGKSAQFPLHDWLPDAMEGPTTVSALIHAATMVKAGVYIVARMYPVLVDTPNTALIIAIIGGFTALFAATMALNAVNIKRVLAYSTISQLGYMFLALGTGAYFFYETLEANVGYGAGIFHLMNHAFFKALLFLSAGAVIHAVHTEDMNLMGGLSKKLKITSLVMLVGCISIAGIPPFSGFWSKDEILDVVFEAGHANPLFYVLYAMGIATAFLTAFYMFRLWFMTFTGKPRDHHAYDHAHEAPGVMWVPLAILAVLAFGSGFAWLFGFEELIRPEFFHFDAHSPIEILEIIFTNVLTYASILVAVAGIGLAYLVYYRGTINPAVFTAGRVRKGYYNVLLARYGFKAGYDLIGLKLVYGLSRLISWIDRRLIDGLLNGISAGIVRGGNYFRRIQTGFVQSYAAIVVLGVALIAIFLFLLGGVI